MEITKKREDEIIKARVRLGNLIRSERERQGLSKRSVGNSCGFYANQVSNVENGKMDIQFNTLLKVMSVLEVKLVVDVTTNKKPVTLTLSTSMLE